MNSDELKILEFMAITLIFSEDYKIMGTDYV